METMILICSGVAAAGAATSAVSKWIVKPLQKLNEKIEKLERIEEGQKLLMKSNATVLQHIITGNHINKLEEDYEKLINFNIEN